MAKKKLLSRRHLAEQSLPSGGSKNRVVTLVQGIVASSAFDWRITGVILLQALPLALEATPAVIQLAVDMRVRSVHSEISCKSSQNEYSEML